MEEEVIYHFSYYTYFHHFPSNQLLPKAMNSKCPTCQGQILKSYHYYKNMLFTLLASCLKWLYSQYIENTLVVWSD